MYFSPIQHSYVAMFRRYPAAERNGAIANNPGMITQIIDQVYETHPSADEMFEAIEMPPTSGRQLGQAFSRWCEDTFPTIHNDIDEWNQCTESNFLCFAVVKIGEVLIGQGTT